MKAAFYESFQSPIEVGRLDDPAPSPDGAVIKVEASGVCRSDWHGWMGHDPDIKSFPHVPGHEFSGTVAEIGNGVTKWSLGDRVTVPFVCGCGSCPECESGNQQICDHQTQPGFTHWGSFAEFVAIDHADVNLVALPDAMHFVTAASLGCRFATSYRGVVAQGRVASGEWVAVHGCGGVGLSAVMIAAARGARVIAIDINPNALIMAERIGAETIINSRETDDVPAAIHEITGRGAHLSIDALGTTETAVNSVLSLRKRGRHIQIGLLAGEDHRPPLPMERVIGWELEILGSHGMQAHCYPEMLDLISSDTLQPHQLIGRSIPLEDAPKAMDRMADFLNVGVTVIDSF
jgi:alcohol dehydrogenase